MAMSASEPDRQRALAGVEAPDFRWILRAPSHVVLNAGAAAADLGQHQRHLRLDPRKAAIDRPDVVAGLFVRRMRRVVGGDHVDGAVHQCGPQRQLVARASRTGGLTRMTPPNFR